MIALGAPPVKSTKAWYCCTASVLVESVVQKPENRGNR